jgi:hypothetical protein
MLNIQLKILVFLTCMLTPQLFDIWRQIILSVTVKCIFNQCWIKLVTAMDVLMNCHVCAVLVLYSIRGS